MTTADDVLAFWFEGDPNAWRDAWFRKSDEFDAASAHFTGAARAARDGTFDTWADTPRGALALILLLDQLPRNLFRGTPEAFASDAKARLVAAATVARGFDAMLTATERVFVYLPFEHAESLADQDESVRLFGTLRGSMRDSTIDYAERHRAVIRRFGRFPHRNAILGRTSTPDEVAYLAEPGAGF
jgi:uncharacterized protein (DUF924 family)